MKALFLSLSLHGHTNPSLPLVRELAARGEEVVYYSAPAFRVRVEATGARYEPYRNAYLSEIKQERMEELAWLLMRTTAEVLEVELEAFRRERADYVIADSVAPWGQWVAQILQLPVVTSISTFALNRHVLAYGLRHGARPASKRVLLSKIRHTFKAFTLMRKLRRRYGVAGPGLAGTFVGSSALNIVYTSRHFQPLAETFDDRYRFIGPSIAPRADSGDFPWDRLRDGTVVYVSMGTLFNTDAGFYRACFDALAGEPVQVILSTGAAIAPESLGTPPPNFIVRPHVPQLDVLRRVSAFVTHGGMNSVSESLASGVPVVVVPQMSEQLVVGRRVDELGAGLFLAKEEATGTSIRDSVRRLLSDERFRRNAAAVRESFERAGGAALGVDAILAFARSRRAEL